MSFTYDLANNPTVGYIRLLIADTDEDHAIFSDEEIQAAYAIQGSTYQSGPFYSFGGRSIPSTPVSYLRVAALLLDTLASNKSRLSGLVRLLDVELSPNVAADGLRKQAQQYRQVDDESGAFVIFEQARTTWGFRDRWLNTIQRANAGL